MKIRHLVTMVVLAVSFGCSWPSQPDDGSGVGRYDHSRFYVSPSSVKLRPGQTITFYMVATKHGSVADVGWSITRVSSPRAEVSPLDYFQIPDTVSREFKVTVRSDISERVSLDLTGLAYVDGDKFYDVAWIDIVP